MRFLFLMLRNKISVMELFAYRLLIIFCVFPFALGKTTTTASFDYPPQASNPPADPNTNLVLKVGGLIDVVWTTTADTVDLVINQIGTPDNQIDNAPNTGTSNY
jgi:hypothetical protein